MLFFNIILVYFTFFTFTLFKVQQKFRIFQHIGYFFKFRKFLDHNFTPLQQVLPKVAPVPQI